MFTFLERNFFVTLPSASAHHAAEQAFNKGKLLINLYRSLSVLGDTRLHLVLHGQYAASMGERKEVLESHLNS